MNRQHEYIGKTADELRAMAQAAYQRSSDSFRRSDTDGFLSQWASDMTGRLYERQAEIVEHGGTEQFRALFDLDGNWVPAVQIATRFGSRWAVTDDRGRFTGTFLPYAPKRRDTLAKRGYTEGLIVRPAHAAIMGGGTGLSGAANAYVGTEPDTKGWQPPAAVLTVDRWAE